MDVSNKGTDGMTGRARRRRVVVCVAGLAFFWTLGRLTEGAAERADAAVACVRCRCVGATLGAEGADDAGGFESGRVRSRVT